MESKVSAMKEEWKGVSFNIKDHGDSGIGILCDLEGIKTKLEDQMVKMQAIRGTQLGNTLETEAKVHTDVIRFRRHKLPLR